MFGASVDQDSRCETAVHHYWTSSVWDWLPFFRIQLSLLDSNIQPHCHLKRKLTCFTSSLSYLHVKYWIEERLLASILFKIFLLKISHKVCFHPVFIKVSIEVVRQYTWDVIAWQLSISNKTPVKYYCITQDKKWEFINSCSFNYVFNKTTIVFFSKSNVTAPLTISNLPNVSQ